MTNKEKYELFCQSTYVPIFSKSWWMDAVCGPENWDVWLYDNGEQILAAMPYYMEQRGPYHYITKAPLTQNNGLLFRQDNTRKAVTEAELQEKIINAVCAFIKEMGLDVYEQQFHHSFRNWQPFFWNNFTNILRYTYIIQDTENLDVVRGAISSKYRNKINRGLKMTQVQEDISADAFYQEHEKVFKRQGLSCPFSINLWRHLYQACYENKSGKTFFAVDLNGNICAVLFLVWDERFVYQLLGGYMPEFAQTQAYPALIYRGIEFAHLIGRSYDFEGSMIKQIAIAFRQFGGVPTPYYRIRKVFNPEIVRKEAEDYIKRLQSEEAEY